MNRSIFGLAASLALVGSTYAAALIDNFEGYTSLIGTDMNGIEGSGWTVSNGAPLNPLDGPVVILDSYTWDESDQSATVGGVEQTSLGVTSLSHTLSDGTDMTLSNGLYASWAQWEMDYTESTEGFRNSYSITVDTNFGNLLTINLVAAGANQYLMSWSTGYNLSGVTGIGEGSIGYLSAAQSTQIRIGTWLDGSDLKYELSNAGTVVSSGILTDALASHRMTDFAVNWDSTSNGGLGNGSLTIDNVSIVPEPSSALLGLLGTSLANSDKIKRCRNNRGNFLCDNFGDHLSQSNYKSPASLDDRISHPLNSSLGIGKKSTGIPSSFYLYYCWGSSTNFRVNSTLQRFNPQHSRITFCDLVSCPKLVRLVSATAIKVGAGLAKNLEYPAIRLKSKPALSQASVTNI